MTHSSPFRPILVVLLTLALLVLPSTANAGILVGVESNGEIVNSNISPTAQAATLLKMRGQGSQIVRANFGWNELAFACGGQTPAQLANHLNPCYNWTLLDSFAQTTKALNMKALISITRTPTWASGNSDPYNMGTSAAQFNNVLAHYVALHTAAGTRYKAGSSYGTIGYWTIHNEPNSPYFWKPAPNAARYALLYARTAVALRAAHPTAKIAVGPTNPTGNAYQGVPGIRPTVFIKSFQASAWKFLPGATAAAKRKYLNAWAHNPYPSTYSQPTVSAGVDNPQVIRMAKIDRLFKMLDSHPLTKNSKVWATEFGWETTGPGKISEARQAQFIAESFDFLDSKRRVELGISYGLTDPKDLNDWQSGTYRPNGVAKLAVKMMQRMVSVPKAGTTNKVKRGTIVRVWGRSNVSPKTGVLAYTIPGKKCKPGFVWCLVPKQKRAFDGSIVASMKIMQPKITFATYDAGNAVAGIKAGYGYPRAISSY